MRSFPMAVLAACVAVVCSDGTLGDALPEKSGESKVEPWWPKVSMGMVSKRLEGGSARAGRLAVVWYQLVDADPDPDPEIAYDVPLDPDARQIVIPIREVRPTSRQ